MHTQIKVDNHAFNIDHYGSYSKEQFVKELLPTVSDFYGDEKGKTAFLEMAFAAIQKAKSGVAVPAHDTPALPSVPSAPEAPAAHEPHVKVSETVSVEKKK